MHQYLQFSEDGTRVRRTSTSDWHVLDPETGLPQVGKKEYWQVKAIEPSHGFRYKISLRRGWRRLGYTYMSGSTDEHLISEACYVLDRLAERQVDMSVVGKYPPKRVGGKK